MNGLACFEFLDLGALLYGVRLPGRLLASTLMLFLLATETGLAQPVSFGLKGGVPLTDAVGGNFGGTSEARRYTVGLMVELRLPASFAFEADGLYKRTGYRASQSDSGLTTTGQVRAHSWEFPLLMKYYLPLAPMVRPFVNVGYVIRHLSGVKGNAHITGTTAGGTRIDATLSVPASTVLRKDPTHGIAVGAGLRLGAARFHVTPEVRYTRWGGRPFDDQGPRGFFLQSSQNQVELLVGLSF